MKARTQDTPDHSQNRYRPGDFVLLPPTKLASPSYTGPFEVIQQTKNDVECRHLVMGNIGSCAFLMKLFTGTHEEAYKAAPLDRLLSA